MRKHVYMLLFFLLIMLSACASLDTSTKQRQEAGGSGA